MHPTAYCPAICNIHFAISEKVQIFFIVIRAAIQNGKFRVAMLRIHQNSEFKKIHVTIVYKLNVIHYDNFGVYASQFHSVLFSSLCRAGRGIFYALRLACPLILYQICRAFYHLSPARVSLLAPPLHLSILIVRAAVSAVAALVLEFSCIRPAIAAAEAAAMRDITNVIAHDFTFRSGRDFVPRPSILASASPRTRYLNFARCSPCTLLAHYPPKSAPVRPEVSLL